MTNEQRNTGGPAFPFATVDGHLCLGMTLRDYFIAHAPTEPQPWFRPTLPPPPQPPKAPTDLDDTEREDRAAWLEDYLRTQDVRSPRLREHLAACDAHRQAEREYRQAADRERYIQWPAAWANAMLKAREA